MHLYAFHIFSIHSLTGGHKVALVNSAEVSTETHKYLQYLFSYFLQIYALEWDCWIKWLSIFRFLRKLHICFHSRCTNYISISSEQRSIFFTSSPPLINSCLVEYSHPKQCELISHCGFDLNFFIVWLNTFSYIYWPSICLLWKTSLQVFCPFLNCIICLF